MRLAAVLACAVALPAAEPARVVRGSVSQIDRSIQP
jgi:hypothetical protein